MWLNKILMSVTVGCLAASIGYANEGCDSGFNHYNESLRIVDSLRLDKPGQMRVFAADGSEFTGGEALWMRGQLRAVARECARRNHATATRLLSAVQELVAAHQRHS